MISSERLVQAVNDFLDTIYDFALESGEHITCREMNSLADLYRAAGRSEEARDVIEAHGLTDEEGDDHYTGENNEEED